MSEVQFYLFEVEKNKTEATKIAKQTADRLQNRDLNLLHLIESLGEYLNNEDGTTRAKTISFLSEVLTAVPPRVLSGQQRNLLCEFILGRFESDSEGIGASARGLAALERLGSWDQEKARKIMTVLLEHTHPLRQHTAQSERYNVLKLVDVLIAKYRAIQQLHAASSDFMPRFVSYFEGEKDPRNLMIVFSILKVPMTEWDISADAQELFDAVFDYFPITFKPPPDDPYGITAQQLKDRLRGCIAATPSFSPYAFPALLDKLDSTALNTKRDVLQTLTACASEYDPRTVSLYAIALWDALKFEILNVQDEDLAEQALQCLKAIAAQLSRGTTGQLNAFVGPVAKECVEHLEDAPTKQSQAAGRILRAITSASPAVSNVVAGTIIPNIFGLYESSETIAKRRGLLEALVELLRSNVDVFGDWRPRPLSDEENADSNPILDNALTRFGDQVLDVLDNSLSAAPSNEISFRLISLEGLLQLSKIRGLLGASQLARISNTFFGFAIEERPDGNEGVKSAAINGLAELARQKPQLIVEEVFPAFMARLPDTVSPDAVGYVPILEAFARLGSVSEVSGTALIRLHNKFKIAARQEAPAAYIAVVLSAMLYIISHISTSERPDNQKTQLYEDIVLPLLNQMASNEAMRPNPLDDERILDLIGRICNVIIRQQPLSIQANISGQILVLSQTLAPSESGAFDGRKSDFSRRKMIVSMHLLAALRRETTLPIDTREFLKALVTFSSVEELSPGQRTASLRELSLLVNKFVATSELKAHLEPFFGPPFDLLNNLSENSILIIFAIVKGLVFRNAAILASIFPSLLHALKDPTYGEAVAHGIAKLLQADDILTKDNHCIISGLHKWKAFALLFPVVTGNFNNEEIRTKRNYLIAVSGMLRWLPYNIIEPELSELLLLLFQSLDLSGEADVKVATVDTLSSILLNSPTSIEEHAGSLVTRLLTTSTAQSNPSNVRAGALRCLTQVPETLRGEIVLPYRRQVVKRLTGALDDRKRVVRTEAVRCRARWLVMDEAEEDDDYD